MATIHAISEGILELDLRKSIPEIINQDAVNLEDRQALQMNTGLKSNGSLITPQYSPFTVEEKRRKGQPSDRVTLRDTGAFQKAIKVHADSDSINFDSTDSKTEKLVSKYSSDIFGLNQDNTEDYVNELLYPKIVKHIESTTGLKMR